MKGYIEGKISWVKMSRSIGILIAILGFNMHAVLAQRIKGSDTCLPMTQQAAEAYMVLHPNANVTVTGGGSGVGVAALLENNCDIAMCSRAMTFDEKIMFIENKVTVLHEVIAFDALAVVVNPSNPVNALSREQLEGIFRGKIKNWKEVGGPDLKIIPYARETSSGTYEFFKELVLQEKNYASGIMSMPATGAIIQSVSQTKGAIGYVGLAYLNSNVKALSIRMSANESPVAPTMQNAKDGAYPVVRPLYYYYDQQKSTQVDPFIEYVLSPTGQQIAEDAGFVPVSKMLLERLD